jgi:hypothetical protein
VHLHLAPRQGFFPSQAQVVGVLVSKRVTSLTVDTRGSWTPQALQTLQQSSNWDSSITCLTLAGRTAMRLALPLPRALKELHTRLSYEEDDVHHSMYYDASDFAPVPGALPRYVLPPGLLKLHMAVDGGPAFSDAAELMYPSWNLPAGLLELCLDGWRFGNRHLTLPASLRLLRVLHVRGGGLRLAHGEPDPTSGSGSGDIAAAPSASLSPAPPQQLRLELNIFNNGYLPFPRTVTELCLFGRFDFSNLPFTTNTLPPRLTHLDLSKAYRFNQPLDLPPGLQVSMSTCRRRRMVGL